MKCHEKTFAGDFGFRGSKLVFIHSKDLEFTSFPTELKRTLRKLLIVFDNSRVTMIQLYFFTQEHEIPIL